MIRDLDETIEQLLQTQAPAGSELAGADISFEIPDGEWRAGLGTLTVNCYLYDIRENREMRQAEPFMQRNVNGTRALRRTSPARIDCSYCITAWNPAASESAIEEHRLLSQVLLVLLRNPVIPPALLQGSLASQIAPYPMMIASPDGVKNPADFWGALDQQLKPSLSYVVTLAMLLDEPLDVASMGRVVEEVIVEAEDLADFPG